MRRVSSGYHIAGYNTAAGLPPQRRRGGAASAWVVFVVAVSVFVVAVGTLVLGFRVGRLADRVDRLDSQHADAAGWWACIEEPGVLYRAFWHVEAEDPGERAADLEEIRRAKRECRKVDD